MAFLTLTFANGVTANVQISWLAPRKVREMVIVGSQRMVQYDDTAADEPMRVFDRGMDFKEPSNFGEHQLSYRSGDIVIPRVDAAEPLSLELADFAHAVRTGATPRSHATLGYAVVDMIEAAEESLRRNGQPVTLGAPREPRPEPAERREPELQRSGSRLRRWLAVPIDHLRPVSSHTLPLKTSASSQPRRRAPVAARRVEALEKRLPVTVSLGTSGPALQYSEYPPPASRLSSMVHVADAVGVARHQDVARLTARIADRVVADRDVVAAVGLEPVEVVRPVAERVAVRPAVVVGVRAAHAQRVLDRRRCRPCARSRSRCGRTRCAPCSRRTRCP